MKYLVAGPTIVNDILLADKSEKQCAGRLRVLCGWHQTVER